jgi:hypothetical protein
MTSFSDEELLARFRDPEGNNRHYAFNLLVQKYQQKIYAHVRRMVIDHDDANDLVQNTFPAICFRQFGWNDHPNDFNGLDGCKGKRHYSIAQKSATSS